MAKKDNAYNKREELENLTLNQGYVKGEDLEPESEDINIMTPREVDSYARKAKSRSRTKGDELKGEGDYESAKGYNDAATDSARRQGGGK